MVETRGLDQYEGVPDPGRNVKSREGEHLDAHIKRLWSFATVDVPLRDPGTTSESRHDVYDGALRAQMAGPCRGQQSLAKVREESFDVLRCGAITFDDVAQFFLGALQLPAPPSDVAPRVDIDPARFRRLIGLDLRHCIVR